MNDPNAIDTHTHSLFPSSSLFVPQRLLSYELNVIHASSADVSQTLALARSLEVHTYFMARSK